MVANKGKKADIDTRLREYELQLRAELLDEHLVHQSFETGAMPTIHVALDQLAASNPAHHPEKRQAAPVAGD